MDDLGRWMRRVLDEVAPPVDPHAVVESMTPPGRKRWPIAVGAAAAAVLLIGGGYWLFSGEPSTEVADDTTSIPSLPTTVTVSTTPSLVHLQPTRVTCNSEVTDFPCSNLFDGDPETEWQAPEGGIGAEITVYFAEPVSIVEIGFINIRDESRFLRNARVRGFVFRTTGGAEVISGELEDDNGSTQRWAIDSDAFRTLTLTLTSAYPAQSYGDSPPFVELALAELEIIGYSGLIPLTNPPTVTTIEDPVVAVISAGELTGPEPSSTPLPYPQSTALEPVTRAEIDSGLADLLRQLAASTPEFAGPGEPIIVIGRVGGVLLFSTYFDQEGRCVHGFDGVRHSIACGGTDGGWTGAVGPVLPDPSLDPRAATALGELGPFVVVVTVSGQPWIALEAPSGNSAQLASGWATAFPVPLTAGPQTVRLFGPNDFPESLDREVTINGTVAPTVAPDIVPGGPHPLVISAFIAPPTYRGDCAIPVAGGVVPCTGEIWRRVTFADIGNGVGMAVSVPASWQAGTTGMGARLSSAVEELPLQAPDILACAFSGVPLLSATGDDVVLHFEVLSAVAGLPARPFDFESSYTNIQVWVPGPACGTNTGLGEYDFSFVDQGIGMRIIRIASAGGPPTYVTEILNSFTVIP